MIVTLTEYANLAADANGNPLPMGRDHIARQQRTTDGAFAALNEGARFVRIATDTNISLDIDGSNPDELFLAGVEFIAVRGGETLTIAAA